MSKVTAQQVTAAFSALGNELRTQRVAAEELKNEIDSMGPEEVSFPMGDETGGGGEGKAEESKEHADASTPAKQKKLLEEAKKDLQAVIDNLEGVEGEAKEEEDRATVARISPSYGEKVTALTTRATSALQEARDAVTHWSSITANRKRRTASVAAPALTGDIATAVNAIQGVKQLLAAISELVPAAKQTTATAVAPTSAEFSGDLWPNGKNPSEIEQRAWEQGAQKFHADVKKENAMPNPATEPRLDNEGYKHDPKPHVNAAFNAVKTNKFASFWDVRDSKTGKRFIASFAGVPEEVGSKNDAGFRHFSSKNYGEVLASAVIADGIDSVRAFVNGQWLGKEASLSTIAKSPDIKNLGEVRKYYAEAYGDAGYAREMTSSQELPRRSASRQRVAEMKEGMEVGYTPKDKTFRRGTEKTKTGPGVISAQTETREVVTARAERAVAVARKIAAVGLIPFTKTSMQAKSRELMALAADNDAAFAAVEAQYDEMIERGMVREAAALTLAHIPDVEDGIVGNTSTGVAKPSSQVKTEGIDNSVKGDAKVSKTASLVPQMQTDSAAAPSFEHQFTTTASRLQRKGVDVRNLRTAQRRTIG